MKSNVPTLPHLPRTLFLAAVVLTVCCADGGAMWHGGMFHLPADAKAELASGESRQRVAATRSERPSRREVRPTVASLAVVPHAKPGAVAMRPATGVVRLEASAALSFAELRLPPPAVA